MIDYSKLTDKLVALGMDRKICGVMLRELREDLDGFSVSADEAEWALSRGFFPGRIPLYGLNESNWRDFISDYAYYMLHPLNGWQRIWVNDKLTLRYALDSEEFSGLMPRYFLYVQPDGRFTYLMDAPHDIPRDEHFLQCLLEREGILAMKPNNGAGGRGFMKVECMNGKVCVNNEESSDAFFDGILSELGNYLVTSYARQHSELAKFWPGSECTLRVIMGRLPKDDCFAADKWHCLVSYARFGSAASGGASNLSSGGVGVGFDYETGAFNETGYRYMKFCPDGDYAVDRHLDTGELWSGFALPNWGVARDAIEMVCARFDSLDYLGFDAILTEDGVQFCEINTMPSMNYEQVICGPVLADPLSRAFFESKGLAGSLESMPFLEAVLESGF